MSDNFCSTIKSTCGPPPRKQNSRECRNQPAILDNYGTCGGVGSLSPSAQAAQRRRAGGASTGTKFRRTGICPPCSAGASVLSNTGAYNCNPNNLSRAEERGNLNKMFPVTRPIYIRRPNNWYIHRR